MYENIMKSSKEVRFTLGPKYTDSILICCHSQPSAAIYSRLYPTICKFQILNLSIISSTNALLLPGISF